ncbi:MAG: hypothetical protein CMN76_11235 [Spirochaetaceae bacterium]|nr:hypothetical protein [Spirochaetaceae bacterium]|tara:strand:+ start:83583 stop:84335 length:753 start_codon:yes stop_codon:yes gene_type:complete
MISYNHFLRNPTTTSLFLAFTLLLSGFGLQAQTPDADRSDPVREFEGSDYLDRQIASRKIHNLRLLVERDLVRLGRLVQNLGGEVEGADAKYKEAAAVFRKAIDAYYSGELLQSYHLLRDARSKSFEIYKSFNETYNKKVADILSRTTSALVDRELAEAGQAKSKVVQETRHRIIVARRQLDLARRSIASERPDAAIAHYRNATVLAVIALAEIQTEKQKADEIYSSYKKELKDAGYDPYPLKPDEGVSQ